MQRILILHSGATAHVKCLLEQEVIYMVFPFYYLCDCYLADCITVRLLEGFRHPAG